MKQVLITSLTIFLWMELTVKASTKMGQYNGSKYNNLVFNIHQSATDVYDSDSMEKSIEYWNCPTAPGLIY
ncbi:hypothetical protein [Fusibacter bizertensis]